jgi:carbon monoxide dehydrogenase subunit G
VIIQSAFVVDAAPDDVYALLVDIERVGPCIPGARVTGKRDDGGYDAEVKLKLGPLSVTYKGTLAVEERDDVERSARLRAQLSAARGPGAAQATMTMIVAPADDGTSHVAVSTDLLVSGPFAQLGQGLMQDVASRLVGEMARAIEARLAAGDAAQAGGEG